MCFIPSKNRKIKELLVSARFTSSKARSQEGELVKRWKSLIMSPSGFFPLQPPLPLLPSPFMPPELQVFPCKHTRERRSHSSKIARRTLVILFFPFIHHSLDLQVNEYKVRVREVTAFLHLYATTVKCPSTSLPSLLSPGLALKEVRAGVWRVPCERTH